MLRYALKRIYSAVIVVLAVSAITFLVLTTISGNSAILALGTDATPEQVAALEHALGLDRPWYEQFFSWLGGLLHLDFGKSSLYGVNVLTLVLQRLPVTLSLAVFSMLMSLTLAVILGTLAAVRKNGIADILCRSLMQVGTAVPGFWLGLIFIIYLSLRWQIFPDRGFVPPSQGFGAYLNSIFLPSLVLAIGEVGPLLRAVRTSMLHSLRQDYIVMARVQGIPPVRIYMKYALRGALAAPLNMAGVQFAKLLGGTTVVESVFSLPGLGRLVLVAVEQRDTVLLQGSVMFVTAAVVLISLAVDLLTAAIDPRMSRGEVEP
ncbi:MAG: ABC transporter permease [Oscillospiraceae bacterium]|nr:ABC transporter permease [Oscillospiraceae bacterium]